MVCVPALVVSDKFLPASSHPLEERAHVSGSRKGTFLT
jgi:hypothetical protein